MTFPQHVLDRMVKEWPKPVPDRYKEAVKGLKMTQGIFTNSTLHPTLGNVQCKAVQVLSTASHASFFMGRDISNCGAAEIHRAAGDAEFITFVVKGLMSAMGYITCRSSILAGSFSDQMLAAGWKQYALLPSGRHHGVFYKDRKLSYMHIEIKHEDMVHWSTEL